MDFSKKFFDLTHLIQVEFDRNTTKYGDKIKCARGCSECCSQLFGITLMDSFIITQHVRSLPAERQAELRDKAEVYIKTELSPTADYDSKNDTAKRLSCPALGNEGECTIYEGRPVICRRFGVPLYDYKHPERIRSCYLNFSDDEEIIDPELIPNQTVIGMKWDELKDEFNEFSNVGDSPRAHSTTIAESIFSALK